jgi:acetamidase/formamidase
MAEPLIRMDPTKSPSEQEVVPHNRWHPEIPAVVSVDPGDEFRVECIDWTGGQIANDDRADDIRDVDLGQVHYLSGPIHVNGAAPGDLLVVDLLDIGAFPEHPWGFTGIFAKENGGSFLTDLFPDAHKAIWDFHGIYATSRHIPGVRFAGIIHPGLIACAPDERLLDRWNRREAELIATDPDRVPPLAQPPMSASALLGTLDGARFDRIAAEAARTIPPREHGGNVDIKNLTRGTRLFLPVYVDGAKLSPTAVAPERDVQVVTQPRRQRDVPRLPEGRDAVGQVRLAEVERQVEPQQLGAAPGDVGVAGEVAVDLDRERVDADHQADAAERLGVVERLVGDARHRVGDLHFSQGDGEITFCGGIEMAGWVDVGIGVINDGMARYGITSPVFESSPLEPRYSHFLAFQGISVDDDGRQLYLDANVSYRRACLNAIEYLTRFGFTAEQAYLLLSTAPVEGRISGIVDIPNACTTVYLPTEIFDVDIRPGAEGPQTVERGQAPGA